MHFDFFKCLLIHYIQAYCNYCPIAQSKFTTVHPWETRIALFSADKKKIKSKSYMGVAQA